MITAFVENNDTTESESDNKGVAFGITITPGVPTIEEQLEAINLSLAAITNAAQTAPRGPNKPRKTSSSTQRTNN
eukprot:8212355-Pyramimonas_sp.AAC.1